MIIGLTNARIKFPDVADLVYYLMNSDEDFDEAEFAFDWSELDQEDSGKHQLQTHTRTLSDLIRPSWETFGADPRYPDVAPHIFYANIQPRLPSSPGCSTPTNSGRGFLTRITTLKPGAGPAGPALPGKPSTQTW